MGSCVVQLLMTALLSAHETLSALCPSCPHLVATILSPPGSKAPPNDLNNHEYEGKLSLKQSASMSLRCNYTHLGVKQTAPDRLQYIPYMKAWRAVVWHIVLPVWTLF